MLRRLMGRPQRESEMMLNTVGEDARRLMHNGNYFIFNWVADRDPPRINPLPSAAGVPRVGQTAPDPARRSTSGLAPDPMTPTLASQASLMSRASPHFVPKY